jgi:hypothetical protein
VECDFPIWPSLIEGADSGPRLSKSGKYKCRFRRSYWFPCRHVIYVFEVLGETEEPNWKELSEMFDESGFEIYTSRELVEVDDEAMPVSRDTPAKLVTSETQTQFGPTFLN